ncbi:MAG: TetR/AcrR family transcriptional regulator [Polyangiaceae bacterium]|nr:TetR/AcrR family transcriptional regulator [Myxococcales bacterium]MCB9585407.1 TetR/AcrR family transcriptional regulator [Polyangiaceae bacterium]MCB9606577.1 TetR/AcrR family transcriptional regulator [Polyangiaceae bacterium]
MEIAPARGRYDRTLDEDTRDAAQRARVLQATAEQLAARGRSDTTVEHIIIHAGISRATFYQHYEDLAHAVADVVQLLQERVVAPCRAALAGEPTPRGQLQAMATAYLIEVESHPHLVLAGALVPDVLQAQSMQCVLLQPVVQDWLDGARRAGLAAPGANVTVRWLAALFEAAGVELVLHGGALGDMAERLARGCTALVR